jgi:phosphoglycerate dehydrogenase-like enzyme
VTKPLVILDPFPRRRRMILSDAQWGRLESMAEVVAGDGDERMDAARVEAALPAPVAILGQTDLPTERLERAERLRAVINVEGNFQPNIDYETCFRRGVEVLSIGPVFALPVAEMALGLALDLARGVTPGDRAMRDGRETYGLAGNRDAFLLTGATIGLIGFGNLGRALNRLLAGFRAQVLVHDPWLPASLLSRRVASRHRWTLFSRGAGSSLSLPPSPSRTAISSVAANSDLIRPGAFWSLRAGRRSSISTR